MCGWVWGSVGWRDWLSCASKQELCVQTERAGRAVVLRGSAQLYSNAAPRLLHQDPLSRTTCCLRSGCQRRLAATMNKTEQKCECSLLCASKLAQKLIIFSFPFLSLFFFPQEGFLNKKL